MRFCSTTCSDRSLFVSLCLPQKQSISKYTLSVSKLKKLCFKNTLIGFRCVSCDTSVSYTRLEGNSWRLQVDNLRVFVDPWLVGNLYFGHEFLFSAIKKSLKDKKLEDFGRIDLIVLSQGLPDHAHVPTLKQIDKKIPVIASRKAAKVCLKLGFQNVQVLRHGDTFCFSNLVRVTAFEGSKVGPPYEAAENAYLFETLHGFRLFCEPHGNVPDKVLSELQMKSVDTLVVPVVAAAIKWKGFEFDLTNDPESVLDIVRRLQPHKLVPLMNSDLNTAGFFSSAISSKGTLEAFEQSVLASGLRTQIIKPMIGEPYSLL
ncbi:hypothetical protein GpartN1_g2015.t1 [Galdieria partita]|uniref:MBL fold metallo-hydrolase n=1 Tax=Galdieria partita TaxID=83374 RepID=A0A9C7UNU1_9RHOD|nr:hypothetical protein GpartN1_g2015.t1 [Galdieria partita]